MRWLWLSLLTATLIGIQAAWLPLVRPFGVVPNVLIVLVVLVALEGRAFTGLVIALIAGCCLDLVSGGMFGIWMGVLVLEVLVAAWVRRSGIETAGPLVPAVMVVIGTVAMAILVLSALVGVVASWPVGSLFGRLLMETLLNLGLMSLMRPPIRRVVKQDMGDSFG